MEMSEPSACWVKSRAICMGARKMSTAEAMETRALKK